VPKKTSKEEEIGLELETYLQRGQGAEDSANKTPPTEKPSLKRAAVEREGVRPPCEGKLNFTKGTFYMAGRP